MEGINWTAVLIFLGGLFVAGVCAFVAGVFWLAQRSHWWLGYFATALPAAFLAGLTAIVAMLVDSPQYLTLPLAAGLCLSATWTGQCVIAWRRPRAYRFALAAAAVCLSLLAVAVRVWKLWGGDFPGPQVVALIGAILTLASLGFAILSKPPSPRTGVLLLLGLVNLTVFLTALLCFEKDSYILSGDEVADFVTNRRWDLVLVACAVSIVLSALLFALLPKPRSEMH